MSACQEDLGVPACQEDLGVRACQGDLRIQGCQLRLGSRLSDRPCSQVLGGEGVFSFKGMVQLTQDMASDDDFGPPELSDEGLTAILCKKHADFTLFFVCNI